MEAVKVDHEKCKELISCLLDDELTADEAGAVHEHIADCAECRAVYEAFSAVSEAMKEDFKSPPEELRHGVMDKIAAAKKKKTRTIWLRTLSAAACLALVVLAYASSGSGRQNNTDGADSSVILNSGNETVNSPVSEDMSGRSIPQQSKLSDVPLYTVQDAAGAEALAELLKPNDENKQPPSDTAPAAELLLTPGGSAESESVLLYFDGNDAFADIGSGIYHVTGTATDFESIIENVTE